MPDPCAAVRSVANLNPLDLGYENVMNNSNEGFLRVYKYEPMDSLENNVKYFL